jgi:hypothetical protein
VQAVGSVQALREQTQMPLVFELRLQADSCTPALRRPWHATAATPERQPPSGLACSCPREHKMAVLAALAPLGARCWTSTCIEPSLEDVFFGLRTELTAHGIDTDPHHCRQGIPRPHAQPLGAGRGAGVHVFSLVIAYFGGAQQGTVGFRSIEFTIASLVSLVIYLIPLIALLLGFDAIVGERERGSLDLLLSLPITRLELLLGKYLGLAAALTLSTLAGFGLVAVLLYQQFSWAGLYHYGGFMLSSVLLGWPF